MTYTPEQLRDLADIADGQGIMADGDIYRAHAAALVVLDVPQSYGGRVAGDQAA